MNGGLMGMAPFLNPMPANNMGYPQHHGTALSLPNSCSQADGSAFNQPYGQIYRGGAPFPNNPMAAPMMRAPTTMPQQSKPLAIGYPGMNYPSAMPFPNNQHQPNPQGMNWTGSNYIPSCFNGQMGPNAAYGGGQPQGSATQDHSNPGKSSSSGGNYATVSADGRRDNNRRRRREHRKSVSDSSSSCSDACSSYDVTSVSTISRSSPRKQYKKRLIFSGSSSCSSTAERGKLSSPFMLSSAKPNKPAERVFSVLAEDRYWDALSKRSFT